MKIIITGGSGRIGYQLLTILNKAGHDVIPTFFRSNITNNSFNWIKLDITKQEDTISIIDKIKPDLVIHAAALADVDLCETDHRMADSQNVQGTRNVVEGCKVINCGIIYISTSYVFNGTKSIYFEDDDYSPATYYGYTKYLGEKIVRDSNLKYLILRTDQPYGWHKSWQKMNSVTRLLHNFETGKPVSDVVDWYNNPTLLSDFVKATKILIDFNDSGIYNIVGLDFINRYEWAKITAEVFNKDKNMIKSIRGSELNLAAKRVNVNLSNQKFVANTGILMKGVREGLLDMLKESKTNDTHSS